MRTINILWTGGLDSTYLMFKLSRQPLDIYPYYVIDPQRPSVQKELETIDKILAVFGKRNDIKATIHQVQKLNMNDICQHADIEEAWKYLHNKYDLGSQYLFLANFARQYNLHLAAGVLFGERSKVEQSLKETDRLTTSEEFPDLFLKISNDNKATPANIIFEHLYFPKFMRNLEKTSEWDYFLNHDAMDIAQMTWFCHRPVLGMTCGHCNPCKDALNEGMAWRVSKMGYVLGTIRHYTFDVAMSILGKIRNSMTS